MVCAWLEDPGPFPQAQAKPLFLGNVRTDPSQDRHGGIMYYSKCPEIVDNTALSHLLVERGADLEGLGKQTRDLVNTILERMGQEPSGSTKNDTLFS